MDIRTVTTSTEGMEIAADAVAQGVRAAWAAARDAHVVITGGRSGAALADAIGIRLGGPLPRALHLWIADERYVEFDDAQRNDTPILAAFPTHEPNLHLHRHLAPHQAEVADAASAYAGELEALLGDEPFDAVVVSMGEDGHIASVFPGHVQHYQDAYAELQSPKPPAIRTTISLVRLANARRVVVLALGAAKADAIRGYIAGDMTLPARQLAAISNVSLVTDVDPGMDERVDAVDPA